MHTRPPHVFVKISFLLLMVFWFCYSRCACATVGCMGVARPAAASSAAEMLGFFVTLGIGNWDGEVEGEGGVEGPGEVGKSVCRI